MSAKRPVGLGRNLSALLGTPFTQDSAPTPPKSDALIPIHALRPSQFQPRKSFDEASLQELAQSIQQQGLLQPIVVRAVENDCYEILAGERRWRACQLAGLTELSVVVKKVTDEEAMVIALVENLQREDLNILEQARGMDRLMQTFALTHQQIADTLSKSRSAVTNILRLLSLSPEVQQLLETGHLDMGHARPLLMLEASQQTLIAQEVVSRALSVRATESLVKRMKSSTEKPLLVPPPVVAFDASPSPLQQFITSLKTKVEIKPGRRLGAGKIVIHYENEGKLAEIVACITPKS